MEETEKERKNWQRKQDRLAERAGLSVLVVEGHQPPALAVSNNNSICRVVQSSATHAERCEPFCGTAFEKATEAGKAVNYRCHAGLYCVAAPLETEEKPLVAIVGRTFLKTADYRNLTERISLGDWQNLPEIELLENVNLSGSLEDLEKLATRLQNLNAQERAALLALTKTESYFNDEETIVLPESFADEFDETENDILELDAPEPGSEEILILDEAETVSASVNKREFRETVVKEKAKNAVFDSTDRAVSIWRAKSAEALRQNYRAAVAATADFIAENFNFENWAWLEQRGQYFKTLLQKGEKFGGEIERISLKLSDEILKQAAENRTPIRLENKNTGEKIEFLPIVSNTGEIRAAIVAADGILSDETRRLLSDFLAEIALPLEVLRLRDEVALRARLQTIIKKFNSVLQNAEAENILDTLVEDSAVLVGAERASLLHFDENERILNAAAAMGKQSEDIKNEFKNLGERIAFHALQKNSPVLVADVSQLKLPPVEREYLTNSFLCLPLSVRGRAIGVLNVTDKRNRAAFGETDLRLLETIAPQIAIALDRARLREKAGEYKTASITDQLTGLLNRRYLEVRLDEEIRRSQRHGYPLSFMMIDVDHFKKYNDTYGHPAGDEALRIVANCLRAALRSADVAARYGGEEFSILLPQTTLSEARLIGERIRKRIETTVFPHQKVTISGGIAAFSPLIDTPQAVIKAADEALFAAKSSGRNNIQIYGNGNGRLF